MLCPSVISRFGTLADKQRFDAASAMGQQRRSCDVRDESAYPPTAVCAENLVRLMLRAINVVHRDRKLYHAIAHGISAIVLCPKGAGSQTF
jgi:hypothetical protein